jgi:hypothetical protein
VEKTQRHCVRVYPSGTRVGSTNYDPHMVWAAGCQMAALNCQFATKEVLQSRALFRDNGGCGFLLKPAALRLGGGSGPRLLGVQSAAVSDTGQANGTVCGPLPFVFRVLSAHYLPKALGSLCLSLCV